MERLIAHEQPDVIFHAAAYKHVPMMEHHPADAVHVNIGGTHGRCSTPPIAAGVERFVLVSTDKAVKPTSVMGASKRLAEMLVADAARRTGRAVRLGPVRQRPRLHRQRRAALPGAAREGGPLTITHPEMTRFFMTIPEAARLILEAAALGRRAATCSCSTWASRSRSSTSPATCPPRRARPDDAADRDHRPAPRREAPRGAVLRRRAGRADGQREGPAGDASPPPPDVREDVFRMLGLASGANGEPTPGAPRLPQALRQRPRDGPRNRQRVIGRAGGPGRGVHPKARAARLPDRRRRSTVTMARSREHAAASAPPVARPSITDRAHRQPGPARSGHIAQPTPASMLASLARLAPGSRAWTRTSPRLRWRARSAADPACRRGAGTSPSGWAGRPDPEELDRERGPGGSIV